MQLPRQSQTSWKRQDSPNVEHTSWGFFVGNEIKYHDENSPFEGPPWEFTHRNTYPGNFNNAVWGITCKGDWFSLGSLNDSYHISHAY